MTYRLVVEPYPNATHPSPPYRKCSERGGESSRSTCDRYTVLSHAPAGLFASLRLAPLIALVDEAGRLDMCYRNERPRRRGDRCVQFSAGASPRWRIRLHEEWRWTSDSSDTLASPEQMVSGPA